MSQRNRNIFILLILTGALAGAAIFWLWRTGRLSSNSRDARVMAWIRDPQAHLDWAVQAKERCGDAPFQMPTTGFIGYLWDDSFRPGHRHSGIDIFGGAPSGEVEIFSASDGYLTRLSDWKSTVIVRVPEDPLQPGRQIWLYYTHMADADGVSLVDPAFPPGVSEIPIQAGQRLGRMGNFSGTPGQPTGVHLHLSVVLSGSDGKFLDERDIHNTLDPSPYLGLMLSAHNPPAGAPLCPPL